MTVESLTPPSTVVVARVASESDPLQRRGLTGSLTTTRAELRLLATFDDVFPASLGIVLPIDCTGGSQTVPPEVGAGAMTGAHGGAP